MTDIPIPVWEQTTHLWPHVGKMSEFRLRWIFQARIFRTTVGTCWFMDCDELDIASAPLHTNVHMAKALAFERLYVAMGRRCHELIEATAQLEEQCNQGRQTDGRHARV